MNWMIAFGGWLWPLLLLASALAGAAVSAAIARWRRRRAAERARASFGAAAPWETAAPGETVVVTGTLGGDDAIDAFLTADRVAATALYAVAHEPTLAKTVRSGRLWVEHEGSRIELEGELRLAVGSVETRAAHGAGGSPLPEDVDATGVATLIERAVRPGDLVRVAGRLTARGDGEGGATYRDPSSAHVLGPLVAGQPLAACFEGTPGPQSSERRRAILAGILGAGLALGALYVAGETALAEARETLAAELFAGDSFQRISRATESPAANLAALSPFHRESALYALRRAREQRGPATRKRVEEMLELARLGGDCHGQADIFARRRAPELFERLDPSCRAEQISASVRAACAVGDLDAARAGVRSGGPVRLLTAAAVHLLADAPEEAAGALASAAEDEDDNRELLRGIFAHRSEDAPEPDHDPVAASARRSESLRCLAAALRVHAGAPVSTLVAAATGTSSRTCALLLHEAQPSRLRPDEGDGALFRTLAALVAIREGDLEVDESVFVLPTLADLVDRMSAYHHGLSAAALEALLATESGDAKARRLAATLLLARARFERQVGDRAAARDSIEAAIDRIAPLDDPRAAALAAHAGTLRVLVEVEGRDLRAAQVTLEEHRAALLPVEARQLEALIASLSASPNEARVPEFPGMLGARRNLAAGLLARNGRASAWTLFTRASTSWHLLRYFATEATRDREQLVEAVRYGDRVHRPCDPLESVRILGHERVIAEALGASEWAAEATTILAPFRSALADPDLALPLILLSSHEYVR